jgi:hypothetical protein
MQTQLRKLVVFPPGLSLNNDDSSGVSAHFFSRPDKSMALKVYKGRNNRGSCPDEAVESWERQKIAHSIGLAPAVGELVDVRVSKEMYNQEDKLETYYETLTGYETERANLERVQSMVDKLGYEWFENRRTRLETLVQGRLGVGKDLHEANVGYVGNRMVPVDFGDHFGSVWSVRSHVQSQPKPKRIAV